MTAKMIGGVGNIIHITRSIERKQGSSKVIHPTPTSYMIAPCCGRWCEMESIHFLPVGIQCGSCEFSTKPVEECQRTWSNLCIACNKSTTNTASTSQSVTVIDDLCDWGIRTGMLCYTCVFSIPKQFTHPPISRGRGASEAVKGGKPFRTPLPPTTTIQHASDPTATSPPQGAQQWWRGGLCIRLKTPSHHTQEPGPL
jgi:hypothetical protein